MGPPHLQGREIKDGDQFMILIENNGPDGFYTEIGRTCVLGKASQELLEEHEFTLEAQRFTLDRLKPGADPREILAAHNDFMRRHGRPEEKRLYAHGQGYDLVERPLIGKNEEMKISADMNIVVHPGYSTKTVAVSICDNYLITESGVSECLHKTPKIIFEI
jgi:Xaa-Pro aminopeptidase